jgi:flagellar motor switch protein FliG
LNPLQKVAIFLFIIGFEKASSIIALMDSNEIKMILPKMKKMTEVSQETHESIWAEFKELGYEENMRSSEALSVIRLLFNGSKISDKDRPKFFR